MNLRQFFKTIWDRNSKDIDRLVKAFPSEFDNDVRATAAILPFNEREFVLTDGSIQQHDFFVTDYRPNDLLVRNGTIRVPYRVYLNEPRQDKIESLSETQQVILHCIYLRHYNGFVRQKHLELLTGKTHSFICPFTTQLLGEYVVEILLVLESIITPSVINEYAEFLCSNSFYWKQTQSRMVSYWNEHYRQDFPRLKDYVGKRLVDHLNSAILIRH